MPRYYGQLTMTYATGELDNPEALDELINRLVDTWQVAEDTNGINWNNLHWTIHEEDI